MNKTIITSALVVSLCGLTSCFTGDRATNTDDANDAAGTGDPHLAREVTGMWLLSTDYNYDQRCNYMPVEYIRSLFKLNESVTLEKYDLPNGCEVRWNGQKVGFYFDPGSPFESVYQSEYIFDKLFQPQRIAAQDSATVTPGIKEGNYHGPNPEGTAAERPPEGGISSTNRGIDASSQNDSTNQPTPGITAAAAQLVTPAQNTPTGVAMNGVGDKAIWEPRKRELHVLYLNHVMTIKAPMGGSEKAAQQGAVGLAMYILGHLNNESA